MFLPVVAKVSGCVLLCLALLTRAGGAQAATYDCAFRDGTGTYTWIQMQYIIEHDEAAGTAQVIDPIITAIYGKPIAAEVSENTAGKVVFVWEVQSADDAGQTVRMRYRATWFKGPQRMRLAALPRGYDNMFEGQGRCTVK